MPGADIETVPVDDGAVAVGHRQGGASLVETGAAEKFDYVITVESEIELRKERLLKKGLYISQIEKRMASQASEKARTAVADAVIRNDGDEDSLLRQVENLWESVLVPQSLG
jgi:dephospho-CoA kinase